MAIVSFDNAIEVSITTFLNLHPSQRRNRTYPCEKVAQWQANYHSKLEFLDQFVAAEGCERAVTTDEIIWYHNLRNELYHSGNGMVPEERSLNGARAAAIWVFRLLFETDPEPLLPADAPPFALTHALTSSAASGVSLSPQAQFLEQYIALERYLRHLSSSMPQSRKASSILWSDLARYLSASSDRSLLQRAREVRNSVVHGEPVNATDAELTELAKRLAASRAELQQRLELERRRKTISTDAQAWEAIAAAGRSVNDLRLQTTEDIRAAVDIAATAAERILSRPVLKWDRGRYTGLPIAIYQNELYEHNRVWRFTDRTLCVLWIIEFPKAKSDYAAHPEYIRGTRTAYNNGRHQAPAPAEPSVAYDMQGRPLS